MIIKSILIAFIMLISNPHILPITSVEKIEKPKQQLIYNGSDTPFNTYYPVASFSLPLTNATDTELAYLNQGHNEIIQIKFTNGVASLLLSDKNTEINYYLGRYNYGTNYTWTLDTSTNAYDGYLGVLNYQYFENINLTPSYKSAVYYLTETDTIGTINNNYVYYVGTGSGSTDYNVGYDNGYSQGYKDGNNNGYSQGYDTGKQDGQNEILQYPNEFDLYTVSQLTENFNRGYSKGLEDATENDFTFWGLISGVMTAPALMIKEMLNFEIFGLNIANLVMFLITVSIVIFVVGLFKKK